MNQKTPAAVSFFTALILFVLLRFVLFDLLTVEGNSMLPLLEPGTIVLISRFNYRLPVLNIKTGAIKRGDIVVFRNKNKDYLVKKVSGIPGDLIVYQNGVLFINGKKEATNTLITGGAPVIPGYIKLSSNQYWLAGCNRPVSRDSREFGPVHRSKITGKVILKIWPPARLGTVY